MFSSFNEPVELELVGDEECLSFKEAEMIPVVVIMDAWYHRPLEIDFDEFSSILTAKWSMTFIDTNDYKYDNENYDEIEYVGIRHCTADDIKGYEHLVGDTFEVYPKSMFCVNDLERVKII